MSHTDGLTWCSQRQPEDNPCALRRRSRRIGFLHKRDTYDGSCARRTPACCMPALRGRRELLGIHTDRIQASHAGLRRRVAEIVLYAREIGAEPSVRVCPVATPL